MTSLLDRLNLPPQERRLVVLTATLFFVMLNLWFVRPHFKDWGELGDRLDSARLKLRRYTAEAGRASEYEALRAKLELAGSNVLPAEQAIQLFRTVQTLTTGSGVLVKNWGQPTVAKMSGQATNSFFEELNMTLNLSTGEPQLVDFLYGLGAGDSLIRVGSLELYPETGGIVLGGRVTLVATYQKRNESKPSSAQRTAALPSRRP